MDPFTENATFMLSVSRDLKARKMIAKGRVRRKSKASSWFHINYGGFPNEIDEQNKNENWYLD